MIKYIWNNKLFFGYKTFDITYDFVDDNMQNYKLKLLVKFGIIDVLDLSFEGPVSLKWNEKIFFGPYAKSKIVFLKNFEKTTSINLWQMAYSERFFYRFNPFYKFNYDEKS